MIIKKLVQGTDAWLQHRTNSRNASDASAMMGCSPYKTRSQLLDERATGIVPDVDAATQARFDRGHAIEEMARPI
ncbi:YqaJ viral recombinase family protein, partial [Photobacterium sanguinicancri]